MQIADLEIYTKPLQWSKYIRCNLMLRGAVPGFYHDLSKLIAFWEAPLKFILDLFGHCSNSFCNKGVDLPQMLQLSE